MSVDFTAPGNRRRAGTWSLIVGAAAIAILVTTAVPYLMVSRDGPDIATYALVIGFATAVLLHLVGFVLGVAALVRNGDSKLHGVLGIILNSTAVLVEVGL
jgi:hypothetical protein